jgi:hypothetical protein
MNTFILGPKGSGKTVLAACMYEHIVFHGGNGNFDNVNLGGTNEYRQLSSVVNDLLGGVKWPDRYNPSESHFYQFSLSKGLIFPETIKIEIVDYGGEYLWGIPTGAKEYQDLIEGVLEFLIDHELIEKIEGIDQRIISKTMSFSDIQEIQRIMKNESIDINVAKNLILIYLISGINLADKLVFLLDGDKVKNFIDDQNLDINRDCIVYAEIVQVLGENKRYAAVITKADVMDNRFVDRRQKSANKWLKAVIGKFERNFAFMQLANIASLDVFGIALETTDDARDGEKKPFQSKSLPVWGYSDLMGWIIQ